MRVASLALLLTLGRAAGTKLEDVPPAEAADSTATAETAAASADGATTDAATAGATGLEGRLWAQTDSSAAQGSVILFQSDNTVFQTSCTEVYRIDAWRADGDGRIVMTEDAAEIPTSYAIDGDELTLTMTLAGDETVEHHFRPATAPFQCPDLR